jgi:hypothetical protein
MSKKHEIDQEKVIQSLEKAYDGGTISFDEASVENSKIEAVSLGMSLFMALLVLLLLFIHF